MIVTVSGNKYQVGCGRGYGIEVPSLEFKLNYILDADRSTWPTPVDTRTQEEKDAGVPGPEPYPRELKEGDIFLLDGTLFAIDHDRLVQVVSETGPLAFQRIFDSIISTEIEFSYYENLGGDYSWDDDLLRLPEDENLKDYVPKYEWMKIWHENFWTDRNLRQEPIIRVTVTDSLLGLKRPLYFTRWLVRYDPNLFDVSELEFQVKQIMCWFYSEIGRAIPKNNNTNG